MEATTTLEYDALDRLEIVTDPEGNSVTYHYDPAGRRDSMTDPSEEVTTYTYDNCGRLKSETNPIGETTAFTYDDAGRMLTTTDGEGTTTYDYDANGNVKQADYPGGLTETASYDRNNRPEQQSGEGIMLVLTYDPAGRIKTASTTTIKTTTTTATYDSVGNITGKTLALTDGEERSFSYSHTPGRRMESATDSHGTTTYDYDSSGRMTGKMYPNGTQTHYSHDNSGAITSLEVTYASGTKTYQVTRDERANVISVIEDATQTTTYAYDASSRLTGENNPWMGNTIYTYDEAGNRLTKEKQGESTLTYAYNTADQLTSDSQGNTYTYNTRGELTTIENGSYTEEYAWDGKGRPTGITDTDGNAASYSYDPRDRTLVSIENDQVAVHLYDMTSDREIALLDAEQNLTSLYHSGTDGLISSATADETSSYYSYNPHSDVSLITDEAGEATASLHYDAWGNVAEETDEPYTYLGKHQRRNSHSTGLIKMGARFYNPDTGRFISRDPLSGHDEIPVSRNPYVYAYDDPVNMKDLTGLCAACDTFKWHISNFEILYAATGSDVWRKKANQFRRWLASLQKAHKTEGESTPEAQEEPKPDCEEEIFSFSLSEVVSDVDNHMVPTMTGIIKGAIKGCDVEVFGLLSMDFIGRVPDKDTISSTGASFVPLNLESEVESPYPSLTVVIESLYIGGPSSGLSIGSSSAMGGTRIESEFYWSVLGRSTVEWRYVEKWTYNRKPSFLGGTFGCTSYSGNSEIGFAGDFK